MGKFSLINSKKYKKGISKPKVIQRKPKIDLVTEKIKNCNLLETLKTVLQNQMRFNKPKKIRLTRMTTKRIQFTGNKVNSIHHNKSKHWYVKHTLNSKARCLQRPTESLPIGSTIDPKHSLRLSQHSFHMGTKSSSPVEAAPRMLEIKLVIKRESRYKTVRESPNRLCQTLTPCNCTRSLQAGQ